MEPKLFKVIADGLNSKERTAKVYASTIRRVHREVFNRELDDPSLQFIKSVKVFNHVRNIVNLTRKKNASTALLQGAKAVGLSDKVQEKYRKLMFGADAAYTKFLKSGERRKPFKNAENTWKMISELHKKPAKQIDALSLLDLGGQVTAGEYKILMSWLYF